MLPLTAFRALEGHIKYALKQFNIYTNREKNITVGSFYKLNKETRKYELRYEIKEKISNDNKIKRLEEAYNVYHDKRNIYSHWDDLETYDSTAMIDNIEEARNYITITLNIIDSYYIL